MPQHMVQYTVKPEQAARNEELLAALFAELREVRPAGLRYAAYKLDDGVTFVHLISNDKTEHGPLPQLAALKAFHEGLRDRCAEAPVRAALSEIGAFGSAGEV